MNTINIFETPLIEYDKNRDLWFIINTSFKQKDESREGILQLNIGNLENFGKVTFSIIRKPLNLDESSEYAVNIDSYTDFIIKNQLLKQSQTALKINFPYYASFELIVNFYADSQDLTPIKTLSKKGINIKCSHYNFVYSNSTFPVLFSACEVVKLDHKFPTYIGVFRSSTFDWNHMPENCYPFPNYILKEASVNLALFNKNGEQLTAKNGKLENGSWGTIYDKHVPTFALKQYKYWIGELASMDENSTFDFYIDDIIGNVGIWFSYGNNIPENRFNIHMFSEGFSSTKLITEGNITTLKDWEILLDNFNTYTNYLKKGADITTIWLTKYSFALISRPNVKYYLNTKKGFLSLLNKKDSQYNEFYNLLDSTIIDCSISSFIQSVKESGKVDDLEFMLKTKWIDNENNIGCASDYFVNNNKKHLIIIGIAAIFTENNSLNCGADSSLMDFMPYIVDKYGKEYNLFYKGHPAVPITRFTDGRVEYFKEHNISVLPNSVPMETYMYLYDNVYIGGYYSSTMTNSLKNQTLFFIADENTLKQEPSIAPFFNKKDPEYKGIFEISEFLTTKNIKKK